jgi:hypothetical protein
VVRQRVAHGSAVVKTPREALADARIRVHQCRNALAEALRAERIADARMAAAVEAEGAPTVRPPPPPTASTPEDPVIEVDGGWDL